MTEQFVLTEDIKKEMLDAANAAYPEEACGIVAGGICYRLPNRSEHPTRSFKLAAQDIADACGAHPGGYQGTWHSHPSGNPFPSDADWASHPFAKALVVATRTEVNVFYAHPEDEGHPAPVHQGSGER